MIDFGEDENIEEGLLTQGIEFVFNAVRYVPGLLLMLCTILPRN